MSPLPAALRHRYAVSMLRFSPATAAIALLTEGLCGYPAPLYRRIRHPVVWMGTLIDALERRLNRPTASRTTRLLTGAAATGAITLIPTALAAGAARLVGKKPLPCGLLASACMAQRSLHQHVEAVAIALEKDGLEEGRRAVSMIVGRDPATLDESAICRAAIETLAENFSDGIVAPALWCALGGLPGAVFYKAVNTADSMIGHRSDRFEAFGKCAARLDDAINLPASRLAALLLILAALLSGADWKEAIRTIRRDAPHHRSPNAGWPEAAMAGALGVALAGPRVYGGTMTEVRWMGTGRADLTPSDIRAALHLYRSACLLQGAVLSALSVRYPS